jgi:hypothetical protein
MEAENREIRRGQKGAEGQYGTTEVPWALQVCMNFTVDAIEVLIKYCTNSFPQVDQFI